LNHQRSEKKANGGESKLSEPAEKKLESIFEKIKDSKLAVIVIVVVACSFTGLILYLMFGRKKKTEAKTE